MREILFEQGPPAILYCIYAQLGDSQEAEEEVGIGTDPPKNIPQSPQHAQQLVGISSLKK